MITIADKIKSLMFKPGHHQDYIIPKVEAGPVGGDQPFNFTLWLSNKKLTIQITKIQFASPKDSKRFVKSLDSRNLDRFEFDLIDSFSEFMVIDNQTKGKITTCHFRHRSDCDFYLHVETHLKKGDPHCETGPALIIYRDDSSIETEQYWIKGENLTTLYGVNSVVDLQNHLILK